MNTLTTSSAVAAPDHKFRQCIQRSALFPGRADGPEGGAVGAKLRSAKRDGIWGGAP